CPNTPAGESLSKRFKKCVMESFARPAARYLPSLAFTCRDSTTLSDFLRIANRYDTTTEYTAADSLARFMSLDAVFIGGLDTSTTEILPWSPKCDQVNLLIKMCINYNKPAFLSAFAFQCLCSIVSLAGEPIRVINGRGKGTLIDELQLWKDRDVQMGVPKGIAEELDPADAFLDYSTGEIYRRSHEFGGWKKYGNVGLHYVHAAEGFQSPGRFFRAPPNRNIVRQLDDCKSDIPRPAKLCETVVRLDIRGGRSYLFEGVPREFLAPARHLWEVHNPPSSSFLTPLAVSPNRGPQIVQLGPLVGVQFSVDEGYSDTVKILNNFVEHVGSLLRSRLPCERCPPGILKVKLTSALASATKLWKKRLEEDARLRGEGDGNLLEENIGGGAAGGPPPEKCRPSTRSKIIQRAGSPPWLPSGEMFPSNRPETAPILSPPCGGPTPRHFTKLEVRKMLHPEVDVASALEIEKMIERNMTKKRESGRRTPYCGWRRIENEIQRAATAAERSTRKKTPKTPEISAWSSFGRHEIRGQQMAGVSREPPELIRKYVDLTPGPLVHDHKFRENDRSRWLGKELRFGLH
ncbi:hypothetical protein FOL47_000765, partial [Perkinsus chesapeaki]